MNLRGNAAIHIGMSHSVTEGITAGIQRQQRKP